MARDVAALDQDLVERRPRPALLGERALELGRCELSTRDEQASDTLPERVVKRRDARRGGRPTPPRERFS
jgi:hypothetical protein